jgi:hypothetical protein
MGNEQNVLEWRRFGHWTTKAKKAHFAAFALWHMLQDASRLSEIVRECAYTGGDAVDAVGEAFRRESAVALELVIKAVIARNYKAPGADPATERVPATHDLPQLWSAAGLPELSREDKYRLLLFKSTLMWSGRYATPRDADAWKKENKEFDALEDPPVDPDKPIIRKPITTFVWSEFNRLYQIAYAELERP